MSKDTITAPANQRGDADSASFLSGGGDMGAILRAHRWADSSLKAPKDWPQSLKTALRIMLSSRQPIWVGWGKELIFFYNDAYTAIMGGKHPAAIGRPTAEVWSEIWPEIGPMLATAMGGIEGTYAEKQFLVLERNGYPEETYWTFSYSPLPDDDGRPGGIICASTEDNTKHVIGERQLALLRDLAAATADTRSWREVCAKAAAALDSNPQDMPFAMIYMADSDRTLSLVGTSGIAPGQALTPESVDLDSALPLPFDEVIKRHEIRLVPDPSGALGVPLPTGAWQKPPTELAMLPILSGGKNGRRGVLVVGLNRLRQFEGNYRDFLGLVAGQLAAAVANADAFEQERRRAEALTEIDRVKTKFFSNVSHEFRTALTLLLGPLEEMLEDGKLVPERHSERLQVVHRNGLRLLKLVNSLLDFSRIEAGRGRATYEPTDLAALTADIASNFRSATEKAGLDLQIECPALAERVYVDREMWEKIVLNLLSNAFKFTFEGGIRVNLNARDRHVELGVHDTGTGIPATELPRVFERFHRIDGARGRSFEGSGIGLALVKELVEAHGGSLRVESTEGRGTDFFISLPLGSAHLPQDQVRGERTLMSRSAAAQAFVEEALRWLPGSRVEPETHEALGSNPNQPEILGKARILLADDNADMRDYISRLLGARHEVIAVEDGERALESLRQQRPDLLLTDIMMPRLDGFALIKAVRDDATLRDLPIIVISARAGEESSVEGLAAGADGYLVKPFSARELIARVDGALAMARVRQEMGEALREEARSLEILNRVGAAVAAELDLGRAVQVVTDAARELTGATYGSFFYNVYADGGAASVLYALSGASPEVFAAFSQSATAEVILPRIADKGIVRVDDILDDERHDTRYPPFGMPTERFPVRSYMTAPVVTRAGEILGALFLGHPSPRRFGSRDERLVAGIAGQAAIAIDNARLFQAAQTEIGVRAATEAALRDSEERQIRLNLSLEATVAERTSALEAANEDLRTEALERAKVEHTLRQSQKMEAVGKLTGGVAHDFNNLLLVIAGNLQLLAKDVAGSETGSQRVRNALAGVARGSRLSAQLLAFGRRQPLAPKVVNLGRFVRGLDDLLRRALGDGVEIETVISGGLWNTLVDPSQVENALLNLAINARDSMDGHGKLTVEAGNAALTDDYATHHGDVRPGQYVMLAVTDTGCGMTPDIIEQVFEPFFTTKPEGQGTGLGLSMVYGFVKQSDGHIKIYSEPGHGTTIRLYLPRVLAVEDVVTEIDAGPITGGTETVLVVEDDEEVRATVVELLSDLGYRVLKARDAQSALAIVESGVIVDLLFTDVVMPGPLRSPELARQTRIRLPNAAVLFTSGYTDNAIVHGGQLDQGIDLLSKPYTREALARRIRNVLRQQRQRSVGNTALQRDPPRAPANFRHRRLKVLCVEDDDLVRKVTIDMLKGLGHAVFEAGDAAQALDILQDTTVDVLMTDIYLPGMAGDLLAIEARRLKPDLKVIFATGADDIPQGALAVDEEKITLLRKPYDAESLESVLQAAAERRSVPR